MAAFQRDVESFHRLFGLRVAPRPELIPPALAEQRRRHLEEEVAELDEAMAGVDLAHIARELADVV